MPFPLYNELPVESEEVPYSSYAFVGHRQCQHEQTEWGWSCGFYTGTVSPTVSHLLLAVSPMERQRHRETDHSGNNIFIDRAKCTAQHSNEVVNFWPFDTNLCYFYLIHFFSLHTPSSLIIDCIKLIKYVLI